MKVIIFFTYGISLSDWKNSGLLDREVKVYDYLYEKYDVKFVFITYGDESDLSILKECSHIEVIPIYKYFKKSKNGFIEILKSFTYFIRLKKIISTKNNILKTNQLWGSWVPLLIKLTNKNPLIVRTGYDLLTFKRKENVSIFKIAFYKILTKYSIKFSDRYLVTSDRDLQQIQNEFSFTDEKVIKISNWVEVPLLKNTKRSVDRLISVGRLEDQKNYEYMIKSFTNSELKIDIIGQGSKKEDLISLAKSHNAKINFVGKLSNQELLNKLTGYKYYISSTLYEGNPKSILEAMAAGCIVIAPNVTGVDEIIKDKNNGILYEFENENIEEIINNFESDEHLDISKNAHKYIKNNHALEVIAEKEYKIYKELF